MAPAQYTIVGAGFSGAVLARELVTATDCEVTIFEERAHLAGNCHTARDPSTEVMVHQYGPHIFHTDRRDVWDYVNRFARFGPFINRVKAMTTRGVFSLPINLHTINQFFGRKFTPDEARQFISSLGQHDIREPANFEEQALKFFGRELYETFFYGYTKKQWGCEPRELPASILKRLPMRFDYNDNYYESAFQGIPEEGYTEMVRQILRHDRIRVVLNQEFDGNCPRGDHLFYTGPLDAWFEYKLGRLGYRTVTFSRIEAAGDLQGNAVMNYPGLEVAFTRVHEHKHFTPWERHDRTVAFQEFSKETTESDVPFYPKRLAPDIALLRQYRQLATETESGVSFLGRLGTYRYLDMDQVIGEALDFVASFLLALEKKTPLPVFTGEAH